MLKVDAMLRAGIGMVLTECIGDEYVCVCDVKWCCGLRMDRHLRLICCTPIP